MPITTVIKGSNLTEAHFGYVAILAKEAQERHGDGFLSVFFDGVAKNGFSVNFRPRVSSLAFGFSGLKESAILEPDSDIDLWVHESVVEDGCDGKCALLADAFDLHTTRCGGPWWANREDMLRDHLKRKEQTVGDQRPRSAKNECILS